MLYLFNAMGSMYVAVLFIGVTNAGAVQPVVSVERFVSYRERAAGMYSALPFAFAQVHISFSPLVPLFCAFANGLPQFTCRLQLSSLMCLHRQLFTAQFSTPWPLLSGML